MPFHNFIAEVYREFLGCHDLVFWSDMVDPSSIKTAVAFHVSSSCVYRLFNTNICI